MILTLILLLSANLTTQASLWDDIKLTGLSLLDRIGSIAEDLGYGVACKAYQVYDFIKRAYGYKHLDEVSGQTGYLTAIADNFPKPDGDFTFDLINIAPERDYHGVHWTTLHIEITVCHRRELLSFITALKENFKRFQKCLGSHPNAIPVKVAVSGTLTFDPSHLDILEGFERGPDLLEVHPATQGKVVAEPSYIDADGSQISCPL